MDDSRSRRARAARAEIASGALRGRALIELLLTVPLRERDAFADELLGLEEAPPDVDDLPRGSVPYLPSGIEEILATVAEAPVRPEDALVDLGSGLGRVVMLAHLLTGARAHGVEIQGPLVEIARARCAALGLAGVSFEHANAAEIALDGSIFYLYSPFDRETLTRVRGRLDAVARRRRIVVCAVGLELEGWAWLERRETSSASLTLYDSKDFR